MTQEPHKDSLAARRGVLVGVGLVGLAGAVTACGAGSSPAGGTDPAGPQASSPTLASVPSSSSPSMSGGAASGALASTGQIPVGGGKIFDTQVVVVTQPSAGEFKAFSAVCTHMGCIVSTISDGRIDCPCHGSQYSITDGAVLAGPAPRPLPAKQIKVNGESIFLE